MKKQMISVCMATVLAAAMLAGGAVQAFAAAEPAEGAAPVAAETENCISGTWKRAEDPALTERVHTLFDRAFDGLEGVAYTPYALLATRTTAAGRQYRVLCKATVVYSGAEMHYAVVSVYVSPEGTANIISATDRYVS